MATYAFTTGATSTSLSINGTLSVIFIKQDPIDAKQRAEVNGENIHLLLSAPFYTAIIYPSDTVTIDGEAVTGTPTERSEAIQTSALNMASSTPSSSYKVYVALLSQMGTDAPTVAVLENTIGDIVWTRFDVGIYQGTLTGAYTLNKTVAFIGNTAAGSQSLVTWNTNEVNVYTKSNGNMPQDEWLYDTPVEIRVYN
jgi:hypothetical protein